MDFSSLPKGLFKLKKGNYKNGTSKPEQDKETERRRSNSDDELTIQNFGFERAGAHKGSTIGLSTCLYRLYHDHKEKIKNDTEKQEKLKKPTRIRVQELKSENEGILKRIEKIKTEEIVSSNAKIEKIKKDISEIRSNPERLTGDKSGKASYLIGVTILLLLTVYLFIFYSSASYSAFFKEFSITELGVANSIFDAQALSKAYRDGVTDLVLIITIPAVFLGLGYLIHKSSEKKGYRKFIFIGSLIFVTFMFDAIIAYEICEKIYNIRKENSFQDIPEFTISYAFKLVSFWLIIFAGFVVYLIWGLVFDFTIEAHEKQDKLRVAVKSKEKEIKMIEDNIEKLEAEITDLKNKENKNNIEINKLEEELNHTYIIPKEFEQYLHQFMDGWYHWMSASLHNESAKRECEVIVSTFIATTVRPVDSTN